MKSLLLLIAQLAVSAQHDLEMSSEILFAKERRNALNALPFLAGYLKEGRVFPGNLGDSCIAQEPDHLPRKMCRTMTLADQMVNLPKHVFAGAASDGLHYFLKNVRGRGANQATYGICGQSSAAGRDGLVEDRQRVAHGTIACLSQQGERIIIGLKVFAADKIAQLFDDGIKLYGAKTEVLAARPDGLRDVFRLCGRQHEHDVIRRLFERLEQSIESGISDLVSFVENIDLEAIARGTIPRSLAQFPDLINATVGSGVDLDYVDGVASADLGTGFANATGFRNGLIRRTAIQRRRQNASYGSFSNTAVAAEYVAMRGPSLFQSILQRAGDMLLPDYVGELLRTVFARENGVAHEQEESIIRDPEGWMGGALL